MASKDDILRAEFQQLIDDITANQKTAGQRVTGRTVESLEIRITKTGAQLWGANYFGTTEKGRKAGGLPSMKTFIPRLMQWIKDRGLSFNGYEDLVKYATGIYWKITRYGTSLHISGGRKDIYTPAIEGFEGRLVDTLGAFYFTEVSNEIENIIKK